MSAVQLDAGAWAHRWPLRWRWAAAFVLGELVGFLPPALVGVALVGLDASEVTMVIGLTAAGVLEGLALGVAQAKVLGSVWNEIGQTRWVAATALAAGFAWLVGMGGSTLVSGGSTSVVVGLAVLLVCGPLALFAMGYLQWLVLRSLAPDSGRWIAVTAGAWLVGVTIPVVSLSVVPNQWSTASHVAVAVLAAVAMGAVVGSITGRTLEQLVGATESPADDLQSSMSSAEGRPGPSRQVLAFRFAWTAVSCFVVESMVVGLAALPAVAFYQWHLSLSFDPYPLRVFLLAAALLPAYVLYAVLLMGLSAEATRLLGWRPPPSGDFKIAELPIELRNWARYAIISHLVHVMAGVVFRSTPIWVWYMRRNGARIGRRVWVNSLQVGDDCLLDFGDEVVIGAGVHLSAHTVEWGLLRLAPIRLGPGTTVGVGAHVGIGVTTGEHTHIGSMSVVPKHETLASNTTYGGIPARPITTTGAAQQVDDR